MSDALTPLMQQYQAIKAQHQNEVLFFRLGDFYEMFDEDAIEVSRLLNLTLTHRSGRKMCGVPYHASKIYIARLLRLGKKIAVCEQITLPTGGKGLAERKVIEVITPGTAVEEEFLEQGISNFLAALFVTHGKSGFAYIDVTTSVFAATDWSVSEMEIEFAKELGRCQPKEILLPQSLQTNTVIQSVLSMNAGIAVSYYPDWKFSQELSYKRLTTQFGTTNLRSFSLEETSPEIAPAGFLLEYLASMTGNELPHITGIQVYHDVDFVVMDDSSRRNLEIVSNLNDGSGRYTLLETVQYTVTAMGSRMLRQWLLSPLRDIDRIRCRQERITQFVDTPAVLKAVRAELSSILDVERLAGRIAMDRAHAKDLQALRTSLCAWLSVRQEIECLDFSGLDIAPAAEMIALISNAILEEPSTLLSEGNLIKKGWSAELDHLHEIHDNFNTILEKYAEEERLKTGISNLKIRYNRLIGYYIEVSKGKLDSVPPHFILRRTLVNGDRYTTERLQELELELNSAGEKIIETEKTLFLEVRSRLHAYITYLLQTAQEIAGIDVAAALAYAAVLQHWVCPVLEQEDIFHIENGRHPVVEMHLPSGEFVPNSLDFSDKTFALITGPNMAGKSTYLRQNALIAVLAQIGSYVPASSARISPVDKIFCRVGASDNLARGESTFLVEMIETAHILRSATKQSLVIMDEVGRGTSTEDGLSIAWAVSEYLLNEVKCKTLFATHYHELTRLQHPSIIQLCLDVLEQDEKVIFLKKIRSGVVANSFGIHVARLAGIPDCVIQRARSILVGLQQEDIYTMPQDSKFDTVSSLKTNNIAETALFSDEELVIDEILSLDPDVITPLEALQTVVRWKKSLSGR